MSGVKISELNIIATLLDGDDFAARRGASNGRVSSEKFYDYLLSKGMLIGNASGVFAENATTGDKYQLDQKALNIFGGAAATVNPDCDQNDRFLLQVDAGGCTLQNPVNVPATENGMFYFQIQAFSSIDAVLTFGGNMIQLTGSCPYDNSGSENIIHCWKIQGGNTYYRVENTLPLPNTVLTEIVTIPRAQVLTSFDTPVVLLAAPATGILRQYLQITAYMEGGTGYTVNTNAQIRGGSTTLVAFSLGTPTDMTTMKVVENVPVSTITNTLIFQNTVGNPTGAAADDVHVAITYIDYPKPF